MPGTDSIGSAPIGANAGPPAPPTPTGLQVAEQSSMIAFVQPGMLVAEQSSVVAFIQPGVIVAEQSAYIVFMPSSGRRRQYYLM